jgi:hypothetical protein
MSDYAPNATVLCVDTWLGSIEHQEKFKESLSVLYETFCVNLWDRRERIVPIRLNSTDGLQEIYQQHVRPDLIYVDWSHDADNVEKDVTTALELFPTSIICGDDYNWKTVKEGLSRVCSARNLTMLLTDNLFWRIQ